MNKRTTLALLSLVLIALLVSSLAFAQVRKPSGTGSTIAKAVGVYLLYKAVQPTQSHSQQEQYTVDGRYNMSNEPHSNDDPIQQLETHYDADPESHAFDW